MAADHSILPIDRHTGKIAHMLFGAGQLVEHGRLAAVLLSGQRQSQGALLRQGAFILLGMVFPLLADAGVRIVLMQEHIVGPAVRRAGGVLRGIRNRLIHLYQGRLRQPERQAVVVQRQLHRVAHRSQFHHRDNRSGDHPHVQQVATNRTGTAHTAHQRTFSDFQIFKCHIVIT